MTPTRKGLQAAIAVRSHGGTVGPLSGMRVVELAGIGPAPFCGMILADLGADVLRVDRMARTGEVSAQLTDPLLDLLNRGKRSVAVDLKSAGGAALVLALCSRADALIEGFRPGVMERLGLGPEQARKQNARLVYARVTGYGQDGPLSRVAGHDLNYLALAGVLHGIGSPSEPPPPPLNVVGDMGGGGMLLAVGILAALWEARSSGEGQVIDAAMVEGASALQCMIHGLVQMGIWRETRGDNLLDGGAHFYRCYETKDQKYVAVAAIEPQFYAELLRRLELSVEEFTPQLDRTQWPRMTARLATVFRSRSRDDWVRIFEGSDGCVAPVLTMSEAPLHEHNRARRSFVEIGGALQPAPVPRFSRSVAEVRARPPMPGEHTRQALADWGVASNDVERWIAEGALAEQQA
jgi:alpha-methylacyl-CoA racemase